MRRSWMKRRVATGPNMIDKAKTAATYGWPVVLAAVLLLAGVLILPDRWLLDRWLLDRWLLDRWLLDRKKGPALELLREAAEFYAVEDRLYGYVEASWWQSERYGFGLSSNAGYFSGAGVFAPGMGPEIKLGVASEQSRHEDGVFSFAYDEYNEVSPPRITAVWRCAPKIMQWWLSIGYLDAWPEGWESFCFGGAPERIMVREGRSYRWVPDDRYRAGGGCLGEAWECWWKIGQIGHR